MRQFDELEDERERMGCRLGPSPLQGSGIKTHSSKRPRFAPGPFACLPYGHNT